MSHPSIVLGGETTNRYARWASAGFWLVCVTVVSVFWLLSIRHLLDDARRAQSVRLSAVGIRVHELQARRAEKDFLLRSLDDDGFRDDGRSRYLDRHREHVESIRGETTRLGELLPASEIPTIHRLLSTIDAYEQEFLSLVALYRDHGRELARLETACRSLCAALSRSAPRRWMEPASVAIVSLCATSPGSLSFCRDEDRDRFTRWLAEISADVSGELTDATSTATLGLIEDSSTALLALAEIERRIGRSEELGKQGELRSRVHAVEPVVEAILTDASNADDHAHRAVTVGLLATCCFMAVLFALAVLFARAASRRNRRLIEIQRRMEEDHHRLLQSERLAAIGQMVTGLAHESRNALQRTHACLDMLAEHIKDRQDALDLVARIEKSQDELHVLYEQVREFAAPLRLDRQPFDLDAIVAAAWTDLEVVRESRDVELDRIRSDTDRVCSVDRFALAQVFRNIFENSLQACDDPVRISVRYDAARLRGQPALRIAVRDNGPGLSAEERSRIFEPFFTTKIHGTGLGMAIAERIVTAHGGDVEIGEIRARGTEIVVTLPREA
jgi:signal transduction histidine kinase